MREMDPNKNAEGIRRKIGKAMNRLSSKRMGLYGYMVQRFIVIRKSNNLVRNMKGKTKRQEHMEQFGGIWSCRPKFTDEKEGVSCA